MLLRRLGANAEVLAQAHALVRDGVATRQRIAPAAEWLLDNYYLIEEQIRQSRRHLPPGYSRRLPWLVNGPHRGLPRVYAIATELIAHADGRVDPDNLNRFVAAYQTVATLTLGELWAIPIMLRLALIENLRRVAARICASHQACESASGWFSRLLAASNPTGLVMVVADLVRENPVLSPAFVAEFARRLQGQNPSLSFATVWIEQRLGETHRTIEQLVLTEHQGQAADQVSIGNSITSLRTLVAIDWREFVEGRSPVEAVLRSDPAGVYATMDFATRDAYRHVVEVLARRCRRSELAVAREVIAIASVPVAAHVAMPAVRVTTTPPPTPGQVASLDPVRTRHIGFYLIDDGRIALARRLGLRPGLALLIGSTGTWLRLGFYLGPVLAGTAVIVGLVLALVAASGWHGADPRLPLWSGLLALGLAIPASQCALACVNLLTTRLLPPALMPRLDFRAGIPATCATMVVVPTMLAHPSDIAALTEALEVRFLGNPDENLAFALLTDFTDADQEVLPSDLGLLDAAEAAILALNRKHRDRRPGIFHLFHRPRTWNERERRWMGEERKRGKLSALNRLLLQGERGSFLRIVGDLERSAGTTFIITLDTDTQLPREEARRLIGTLAHPLNRAVTDPATRCVVRGHGVLQPRVGISLPSTMRSEFATIFAGEAGIDPYTRTVSDVYQDVFGEGSFIGKGIYDVAAFEAATGRRFPANAILSHDLIEGCCARSGLVSDVLLVEDMPARYLADVTRRHRWMRGDWQILAWMLPWVHGPIAAVPAGVMSPAVWHANPLSLLSRWKICDNLRRSLVPPAMLLLLVGGWTVLPGPAWAWTMLILGLALVPTALNAIAGLVAWPPETRIGMHLAAWADATLRAGACAGMGLILLPFEAWIAVDAMLRTWWRMGVSRRHLLAWRTASDAEGAARTDLAGTCTAMAVAPLVAIGVAGVIGWWHPVAIWAALPLCLCWFLSPLLAWWISRPRPSRVQRLDADDGDFLGRLARRTWRYFESLVTAEDHWLPPDNFQEYAINAPAHRTSPTNLGLCLLGNLAARDFGYLAWERFLERCERTTGTMRTMERHRGHFFNWYDTLTLEPLAPRYISTVDSGNLAAHLTVLRAGLNELPTLPWLPDATLMGIRHTVGCLGEAVRSCASVANDARSALKEIRGQVSSLEGDSVGSPATFTAAFGKLGHLRRAASKLNGRTAAADTTPAGADRDWCWWAAALERECQEHQDSLALLTPWAAMRAMPSWFTGVDGQKPALDALRLRLGLLDQSTTLAEIATLAQDLGPDLDRIIATLITQSPFGGADTLAWLRVLRQRLGVASVCATALIGRSDAIRRACTELADMDHSFLYDRTRELFAIGFNVADKRLDRSYYDLLASEARLGSFVAIAQGRVAQEHWFALGRQLTVSGRTTALLSWSGSLFEYLMPQLVMPTYAGTLLDATDQAVVARQIEYGRQRGVPWGISESGYNRTDAALVYQYRAFGVPGLGFKRGLADDLVIAPYASALALIVAPAAACANLRRLHDAGHAGPLGMYEAVDYTPVRLPAGATVQTVRSYMAHHQGMSLLALAQMLLGQPMQRRFCADPQFRATLLLLQERTLRTAVVVQPHASEATRTTRAGGENEAAMRVFTQPDAPLPEVHLLSNGRYHVHISASGGGSSRWKGLAVNRWREDPTCDSYGMFCYLRDVGTDVDQSLLWSNTYQPTVETCPGYEAIFTQARAEFRRSDHELDVHTQISVSSEDDIELRRITLTNRADVARTIELTSYTEVVDAPPAADAAHPAFSNLFVQTHLDREHQAILCSRRPRSAAERPAWMFHLMAQDGGGVGSASYETDRMRFIGRGRTVARPQVFDAPGPLGDSAGPVLDPVAAIRRCVRLEPDTSVDIDLVFGMADSRVAVEALINKYHDQRLCERVFGLARAHSQVVLRQLGASEAEAQLYGRLASAIIHPLAVRRAPAGVLARNRRSQAALWAYGISGDLPIVLLRISDDERLDLVRELLRAHVYWRSKGLNVDLVIWNEDHSLYRQALHDRIAGLVASGSETALIDKPGGVFVRRSEQMSDEDRILLQTVARMVISDTDATLAQFADRTPRPGLLPPKLIPGRAQRTHLMPTPGTEIPTDLICANGLGGFTRDGREYIITLEPGRPTPLPWVNVLANPEFGTVISESGGAYSWAGNCHEFRLTPWHNDPVGDPSGEAFYLRDEETGRYWSPTPAPARGRGRYVVRHGFGYTAFQHEEDGIGCESKVYIAIDAPVKLIVITLRNRTGRPRRLSLTGYWEWVLGEQRSASAMHVVTELDLPSGAITARNPYHPDSGGRLVFVDASERGSDRSHTGDRAEFLGRNGQLSAPAALARQRLSGRLGAGLDPCAALQVGVDLAVDEVREVVFVLGAAGSLDEVRTLCRRFAAVEGARHALEHVWQHWNHLLGAVQVETPDPTVNLLANGWLVYQTIACRMWARSGFYQSGGAFGFRDQLQDAMALVLVAPWLLREHLLRAAAHQFREGDVQHWWHPPVGRGVRTHSSDDYLWLPYAVAGYCLATGDTGVLDVPVPFIEGRAVPVEEESYYDLPTQAPPGTLYEHATRAILHGLRFGAHGLPLMGCGDWNDGMNRVGAGGTGESVWLAFFLHEVLTRFVPVALAHGDAPFAARCRSEAATLAEHIEADAWDGKWYRRAYFDDGTPLGSAGNAECRIDVLPQSWAVLSGAGDPKRARAAMDEVDSRLIDREHGLIKLFAPPFDTPKAADAASGGGDPGYIKGYVPGVRENGGQYTHAAIWTVMAFAQLGETERAWELWSLINPVAKAATPAAMATYQAEPYVVAADVYALAPHVGRGGWPWYTGSAGWMYRLLTGSLLGLRLEKDRLYLDPQMPAAWPGFTIHYRHRDTHYRIRVEPADADRIILDGATLVDPWLPLTDDHRDHAVVVQRLAAKPRELPEPHGDNTPCLAPALAASLLR